MELWTSSLLSDIAKSYVYELKSKLYLEEDRWIDNNFDVNITPRRKFICLYNSSIELMKNTEKINSHFALWIYIQIVIELFNVLNLENNITQDLIDTYYSRSIQLIADGLDLVFHEPIEHKSMLIGSLYSIS